MKVQVTYRTPKLTIDQTFSGETAESVVAAMKEEVARRAGFAVRLAVHALTPLRFAQEVVSRYNDAAGARLPLPASCEEFLRLGQEQGILSVLEP